MAEATSAKRILFVDDDHLVTDGLRRALRKHRDRWDLSFALSGQEAIRLAEQQPFDAVVTDLQMPGMDGIQLLERFRLSWPGTVRITLSGQSEARAILKSIGPSHQFLSKPCQPRAIETILNRAFDLRRVLGKSDLVELVAGIDNLPSLPSIYLELVEAIRSESPPRRIGELISRDIAMTTQVLKLVNSSYFGLARHIDSAGEAAILLGTEILQSVVLGASVFGEFQPGRCRGFSMEQLWDHSAMTAGFCRQICTSERADTVVAMQSTTAGFLHGVGSLVLAAHAPDKLSAIRELQERGGLTENEAAQAVIGATQAEIGAYLLGLWGFSDPIVEAVAYRDVPGASRIDDFGPLAVLHAACALAGPGDPLAQRPQLPPQVDSGFLEKVGVLGSFWNWAAICTGHA